MNANKKDLRAGLSPMQHQHFATIATIIRGMPACTYDPSQIAKYFAYHLSETNPKFDRARFLAACEPKA